MKVIEGALGIVFDMNEFDNQSGLTLVIIGVESLLCTSGFKGQL